MWGYSNLGHAGDKVISEGRSGYVFLSVGAAINWRSAMMKVVTQNSSESEYVGLSEVGNEAMYSTQMQGEMGIGKKGILLLWDRKSSLKLAIDSAVHQRSKHICIKYHLLRDRVEALCKIDTSLNVANMLTKHLGAGVLRTCKALVGVSTSG